jgi:hypothetical protein
MYKCKEIIELTSKNMETSLPWYTRMEMKAHFLMCETCNRYAQQLQFMNKALGAFEGSLYQHSVQPRHQLSISSYQRYF